MPVLQTGYRQFIQLIKTPDYSQFKSMPYSIHRDPVWSTDTRKNKAELERVTFYHCDQVGTPQTLSNEKGECIWEIALNTWGKTQQVKAQDQDQVLEQTNIRFQGQYFDEETGLHYNRYRYYEPHGGRYVSKDPIGLFGGFNTSAYVSDPNQWVDVLGLMAEKSENIDRFKAPKGSAPWVQPELDRLKRDRDSRVADRKRARDKAENFNRIMNEHHSQCEEQLVEYIACSGGVGPAAGGFAINLYNGKIFTTGSVSTTSIPIAVEGTILKGPMPLAQATKYFGSKLLARGGECVGGHVVNKKIRDPKAAIDSFLTGESTTVAVGVKGVRVGVVIPEGEEVFDSNSLKGVQVGLGTPGADISIGYGYDSGYRLKGFN